jgi:1,2-diacylglycerol 3-alpha-glucosyltransferase
MKIGLVTYWFNRGQAVISRHLRQLLDEAGHSTVVLARLTRKSFFKPLYSSSEDVWSQSGITLGSAYDLSSDEYLDWVKENKLDAVFFFQNLQFDCIKKIRDLGVKTYGAFVWESFGPENVGPALEAFDCIYSLTRCEQKRYALMGIDSPFIGWGCHPELFKHAQQEHHDDRVVFFYPGGYLSKRKPTFEVIEAFTSVYEPKAQLVIKAQHGVRGQELVDFCGQRDPRIKVLVGDLSVRDYLNLFARSDVSLAPSKWEGVGLHLFEAVAFGIPTITSDGPPMNEIVDDEIDGLLVKSSVSGYRRPGVPILEPDANSLTKTIIRMCDDNFRDALKLNVKKKQEKLSWDKTVKGFINLLENY